MKIFTTDFDLIAGFYQMGGYHTLNLKTNLINVAQCKSFKEIVPKISKLSNPRSTGIFDVTSCLGVYLYEKWHLIVQLLEQNHACGDLTDVFLHCSHCCLKTIAIHFRYWWLKVNALAESSNWSELENFAKSKKTSPIGYRPFVEACVAWGNKQEAAKYLTKIASDEKVRCLLSIG